MEGVENSKAGIDSSITSQRPTAASEADYEAKHIIPLASLTPETALNGALVKVVVALLLFPYSPSTQTLRLVLSEKDFRLREKKGQLRVSFHGAAASKLAETNVGIGDMLVLSTREARFHKLKDATLRDVPWSLRFDGGLLVKLKLKGSEEWDTVEVNETHEDKEDDGGRIDDTIALPNPGLASSGGAFPALSGGLRREWRMPASFKRTALPPEPSTSFFGESFNEEELLEELEEPMKKKPRFAQSRYRLISGDKEQWDKPQSPGRDTQYTQSSEPLDQVTEAIDNIPTVVSTPTITVSSEETTDVKLDTLQKRFEVPDELRPEVPDSPDLKPVDSSGLPLISPLEHRGLSFTDYIGTRLEGPAEPHSFVGRGFGGSSNHLSPTGSAGEQVFISSPPYEFDITPSRSERSTGPNSLFDSLSPTPVQELLSEERGKSPVHPSPLRIVETFSSTLRRDSSSEHHGTSTSARKTPLLLPQVSPIQEQVPKPLTAPALVTQPELSEGKRPDKPAVPETPTKCSERGTARRESDPLFGIGSPLDSFFGKPKASRPNVDLMDNTQEGDGGSGEQVPQDTKIEVFVNQSTTKIQNQNVLTSLSTTQSPPSPSTSTTRGFKSGVTTILCDYPPLSHLTWGHTQDFIGVVCRTKPIERAKRGQKDYFLSMRVVDSSLPLGITVSILRPFRHALPAGVERGDCMLFRNFKVSSYKHKFVATSCNTSAYAVWRDHGQERPAVVVGPPVEYSDEEEDYVRGLGAWFESLDEKVKEKLSRWPEQTREAEEEAEEEAGDMIYDDDGGGE